LHRLTSRSLALSEVFDSVPDANRIVFELTQTGVAGSAEDRSDPAGAVVVVDVRWISTSTDRTDTALFLDQRSDGVRAYAIAFGEVIVTRVPVEPSY